MITLSYAVDERIDEFARAFVAILRRLINEQQARQNIHDAKEKNDTNASRASSR
ncbi:MAG: hypothetical protein IPP66_13690 [Anaerolineales bacterium]|nr:hypothetical protein [Anaerolineales bacterium]